MGYHCIFSPSCHAGPALPFVRGPPVGEVVLRLAEGCSDTEVELKCCCSVGVSSLQRNIPHFSDHLSDRLPRVQHLSSFAFCNLRLDIGPSHLFGFAVPEMGPRLGLLKIQRGCSFLPCRVKVHRGGRQSQTFAPESPAPRPDMRLGSKIHRGRRTPAPSVAAFSDESGSDAGPDLSLEVGRDHGNRVPPPPTPVTPRPRTSRGQKPAKDAKQDADGIDQIDEDRFAESIV